MIYSYIDFEYNRTQNRTMNVLCVALTQYSQIGNADPQLLAKLGRDLRQEQTREKFCNWYNSQDQEKNIFVSFNVEAEARALLSLGLDPNRYGWIDLYLEYRMLLNNHDRFEYGKQLIKGMEVVTYKKSKWDTLTDDDDKHNLAEHNLAAATYKLLGLVIDTDHKTLMRDIIISGDETNINENMGNILAYCLSDVTHLHDLRLALLRAFHRAAIPRAPYRHAAHARARFAIATARMVTRGYPIDTVATQLFSGNVEAILEECKQDINAKTKQQLGFEVFTYTPPKVYANGRVHEYAKQGTMNQKGLQDYIAGHYPKWLRSKKTKKPLLKVEVLEDASGAKHTYSDDVIDQLLRFARLKQSLNGFMPAGGKRKSFWDFVGDDGRVRPFFKIYGSQSSRSQPSSTSFIPLKSAWMRYLIQPPEGRMIVGLDFASQEFLIAGLLSLDVNMVASYLSGDPYLAFAIMSRQCPAGSTRKTHGDLRDRNKSSVLGILYKMGAGTLSKKISKDTGEECAPREAELLIEKFETTYAAYTAWCWETRRNYEENQFLQLKDGWTMFGDNDNWRSVVNCPVQGSGAVVMRESVFNCDAAGLDCIFTLHDALYIECDLGDWGAVEKLAIAMTEGFSKVCGDGRGLPARISRPVQVRLDGSAWGYGLAPEVRVLEVPGVVSPVPVKCSERYIDGRSKADFEKFKKYLTVEGLF